MFELTVPPASNVPPPHSHSRNEEIVYVLEGTLRYTVGSDARDLTPGQSMQTPRGTVHAFSNPFAGVARALIINSPDILLSGFMFPFRGMPVWAQLIGQAVPVTHFLRVVRGSLLKGEGVSDTWPSLTALGIFVCVVAALAMLRYRRTLD
jgi:hypothetical protein